MGNDGPFLGARLLSTLRHLALAFLGLALVAVTPLRACGQLVFLTEAEQAQDEFFEGNYDDALFRLENARKWLGEPANKAMIQQQGGDHTVQEALGLGMKAQMLAALGEGDQAQTLISLAKQKLASRRTHYIKKGQNAAVYWLYEAFLDCVQGDIEYAKYVPPGVAENVKCLPPGVFSDDDKRLERCRKHYDRAMATLDNPIKGSKGGQDDVRLQMGAKICMSHGRVLRLMADRKTAPEDRQQLLRQAKSYYDMAEQKYRARTTWKEAIDADSKFPVSLATFEKVKQDNKDVAVSNINARKHEYVRTVIEWVYLAGDQAELTASLADLSQSDEERSNWIDATNEQYKRISDLCSENFKLQHPIAHWLRLSHARFLLSLARADEALAGELEAKVKRDEALAKPLMQAKNRAVARRRMVARQLDDARTTMEKQLSPRHPLILDATLLQLESIPADDKDRGAKIEQLCGRIKQLVELRSKGPASN